MVFSGLVTAWRLAGWPTSRSPSSVNATIEGVVRMPSAFSMTFGAEPSITATQELVVPRSMPMTLPIGFLSFLATAGRPGPRRHPDGGHARGQETSSDPLKLHVKRRPRGVQPHIGEPYEAARRQFTNPRAGEAMGFHRSFRGPKPRSAARRRVVGPGRK